MWLNPQATMRSVESLREAQFLSNMDAFQRHDFYSIDRTMRPDVTLTMPGTSWLAGTHSGHEAVSRFLLALREALQPDREGIIFRHGDDQMVVLHDLTVAGPRHQAEMTISTWVRYDRDGRMAALDVMPGDLPLFDHILNSVAPADA
jgi:hypothetical protein